LKLFSNPSKSFSGSMVSVQNQTTRLYASLWRQPKK